MINQVIMLIDIALLFVTLWVFMHHSLSRYGGHVVLTLHSNHQLPLHTPAFPLSHRAWSQSLLYLLTMPKRYTHSRPRSIKTPLRISHHLIIETYFSVRDQDAHGKASPGSGGGLGETRLLVVRKPIILPAACRLWAMVLGC
jgi:hypothetical protein